MLSSSKPWWMESDSYVDSTPVPLAITDLAGDQGPALVKVYEDGRTQPGWGLAAPGEEGGFMPRYAKGEFLPKRALYPYMKKGQPFAFVMRSVNLVALDIDGKNGGLEGAKALGNLPVTLAETSKSGTGYHLFFTTPDDVWNSEAGFAQFSDRIGIRQGVDFRAVGCVYHHDTQRWNNEKPVPLPDYLVDVLTQRQQQQAAAKDRIQKIKESGDPMETMMMTDQLLDDLKKPIPAGRRNNTLFAIGQSMKEAEVDGWDILLYDRALQVGLSSLEADKLVANVQRYSA